MKPYREEMRVIFETHDLAFKGKDFYGFRLLQLDGRILEFYWNEESCITIILQEEDKILKFNRVLDMEEIKLLLDIYRVWGIRPKYEIILDFSWETLLNLPYLKNREIIVRE